MSFAKVYCRAALAMNAPLISVEAHVSRGLPKFSIVGLPEVCVRESKERVRSALLNSQFDFPARRITINLAPADLPKSGSRFDLAIALSILAASQQIPNDKLAEYEFLAELALDGQLRGVNSSLPHALACQQAKRDLIIAKDNQAECCLIDDANILIAEHLIEVCHHLQQKTPLITLHGQAPKTQYQSGKDISDIKGQVEGKHALSICASGGHSLLMSGPPGTGKTMLATRLPSLLPQLTKQQALAVAAVKSIQGNIINTHNFYEPPFRAPHHTASSVALVGGGSTPLPGEISLAHHGILFLDELPEFQRSVLEALREPLESGQITISRAAKQAQFPAEFQLVCAMNPCPCGYYGDDSGRCHCTMEQIARYQQKISGPLLDRIDCRITVNRIKPALLTNDDIASETSEQLRQKVINCRQYQYQRQHCLNSKLTMTQLKQYCPLTTSQQQLLSRACEQYHLSPRSYHRLLKLTRTIADWSQHEAIRDDDLFQALAYR